MGAVYWIPIAVIVVLAVLAGVLPSRFPDWPWRAIGIAVGVVLVVSEVSWMVLSTQLRPWSAADDLPLQLCDVGALVAAAALFWPRVQVLDEIAWFWGLGASPVAILIPDPGGAYPGFIYFQYYVVHGGMIVAALLLATAFGLRLTWASALRGFGITLLFAVAMSLVDLATGGDYLFLRSLPGNAGPLLRFGTWPQTAVLDLVLAALLFCVLTLVLRRRTMRGR